jgi:hypothetical protein
LTQALEAVHVGVTDTEVACPLPNVQSLLSDGITVLEPPAERRSSSENEYQ